MRHNEHSADRYYNECDLEECFRIFVIVHERDEDKTCKAYNKGEWHASHDNADEEKR